MATFEKARTQNSPETVENERAWWVVARQNARRDASTWVIKGVEMGKQVYTISINVAMSA